MRVVVERDGRSTAVDVAPGGEAVTVDGHTYPVVVVRRSAMLVELEIAGERVVVENWPDHFADPPGPVDVNGERSPVQVRRSPGPEVSVPAPVAPARGPVASAPVAPTAGPTGGHAVVPPMPGKVIEVRVAEGQTVRQGEVLLVLEAMKMRNELVSPIDGIVRDLRARAGANAPAKQPLLFVVPA